MRRGARGGQNVRVLIHERGGIIDLIVHYEKEILAKQK